LAASSRIADFALAHETPWSRDIASEIPTVFNEKPPENETLGPVRPRGGPAGVVLQHGHELARWGDSHRADITFSVAKSYLSILTGIAHDDGLIRDVEAPVAAQVDDPAFSGRNAAVTWHHLLQQTSEWEGTLWGKADAIDRNRVVGGGPEANAKKGTFRALAAPGGFWEYNDVRVNVLAWALLLVFRRPLPEVFAERILKPIGTRDEFEWHGYRTSWVTLDGRRVQSVSGGSHWGGGVFASATDQARIGRLMLQRGEWEGRRLLSERWIEKSLAPCTLNPGYGYMWWLNTERRRAPAASARAFCAVGAGGNYTWIEPERDLVAVARWLDPAADKDFIATVMEAAD
jgi:CubicO group peptidase (beta-lactamase class C family)